MAAQVGGYPEQLSPKDMLKSVMDHMFVSQQNPYVVVKAWGGAGSGWRQAKREKMGTSVILKTMLKNPCVETVTPDVLVFEDEAFGSCVWVEKA